jgi:hypothetical protein
LISACAFGIGAFGYSLHVLKERIERIEAEQ